MLNGWIPLYCAFGRDDIGGDDKAVGPPAPQPTSKAPVKFLTCDSDEDVDMEDVEVLVQELRQDKEFIQVGGP